MNRNKKLIYLAFVLIVFCFLIDSSFVIKTEKTSIIDDFEIPKEAGQWIQPSRIGLYEKTLDDGTDPIFAIKQIENISFIATGEDGVLILNSSDPRNPEKIGQIYNGSGYAHNLFIQDNLLYLADGADGMEIINISIPSNPEIISTFDDDPFDTSNGASNVFVSGNYAYLTDYDDGLKIINVTDPYNPTKMSEIGNGATYDVFVNNNFTYLIDDAVLKIINVTNPALPVEIASSSVFNGGAKSLIYKNDMAFVGHSSGGLVVYNVSNSTNIEIISEFQITLSVDEISDLFIVNDTLVVAWENNGVIQINITDIENLTLISQFDMYGDARGVDFYEDFIFIARGSAFEIIDWGYDSDSDNLTDGTEIYYYFSNPHNIDTDNDGLNDGDEVHQYHTNPINEDTDGDGLNDGDEVHQYDTDPLEADTDNDGYSDGEEILAETDPLDPNDHPTTPGGDDPNGDDEPLTFGDVFIGFLFIGIVIAVIIYNMNKKSPHESKSQTQSYLHSSMIGSHISKKLCANCGFQNKPENRFCEECGVDLVKQNTSVLDTYLQNYKRLDPYEFENMVGEFFRLQGWKNVEVTTRSNDKGRDVIGIDLTGQKVYIEVKQHNQNIGRPVVQKLHSIMITENVHKGIVVTTSGFTTGAIEYANEIGIRLIDGKEFLSTCSYLTSGEIRQDFLCMPVNLSLIEQGNLDIIDQKIFSYPLTPSKFIQKTEYIPFYYTPHLYLNFSVQQRFSNSTGSWQWDMVYINQIILIEPRDTILVKKLPFSNIADLNNVQSYLTQKEIPTERTTDALPFTMQELKRSIQYKIRTIRTYRALNNRVYNKECVPSLSNIHINQKFVYWTLKTGVNTEISENLNLETRISEDQIKLWKIENHTQLDVNSKKTHLCQICKKLMYKGGAKKNTYKCRHCGASVCDECVKSESNLIIFKKHWCLTCNELVKKGIINEEKNKLIVKDSKNKYKEWKKNRM